MIKEMPHPNGSYRERPALELHAGGEPRPVQPVMRPDPAEGRRQLTEFIDLLIGGRWIILATFLLVITIVAAYTFTVAPEYQANSILMVDSRQSTTDMQQTLAEAFGIPNRKLANEVEFLRQSEVIAERAAAQLLEMKTIPGTEKKISVLETETGREPSVTTVALRLQGKYLSFSTVGKDVDMIRVTATSTDPREAAMLANLYSEQYLRRAQEASRARISASKEFLSDQEVKQREQLRALEEQLQTYMSQNKAVALDEEAQYIVSQIAQLESERDQARIEVQMKQSSLRALEEELARIEPNLARRVASGVEREIAATQERIVELEIQVNQIYNRNPELRGRESEHEHLRTLTQQIVENKRRVEQLSKQYVEEVLAVGGATGGGDPTGLGFVSQAAELKRRIAEARINLIGLQTKVEVTGKRLQEYESKLRRLPAQTIQLAQLQRGQQSTEKLYLFLVEKLQEARVAEQSELGYAEVIRSATVPSTPVRPRKAMNLALGAMLGLMMGIGLAWLRKRLDTRLRVPESIREAGHSLVGVIPDMTRMVKEEFSGKQTINIEGKEVRTSLVTLLNPLSPISEAYRRLRTNIQFSRADTTVQTILVTSAGPGEGKTVTTMNLAITMAQAGRRTLYIDADLRRPTGHKMLDLRREPGLTEILFELQAFEPDFFATPIDELYAIPAGSSVPNPAELLGSQKMREFLQKAREQFDVVIVDTPPVLAVTDALLLSPESDAAIVVVSAGQTDTMSLSRTAEALQSVGAPLIGAVMNRFDPAVAHGYYGYGYGYGYYYYDYYSEREETPRKSSIFSRMR